MPLLDVDGVAINYIDQGQGPAIVLVHGFASNLQGNWRAPGIVDALVRSGRRVIALDCRGHGRSAKPHDPAPYAGTRMADDVIALMDHLGIDVADLAGYSMGAFLSASLIARFPARFRSVILGGVGDAAVSGVRNRDRAAAIARAMEAEAGADATDATARGFRVFAERSGNDLQALAAMQRSERGGFDPQRLRDVQAPVLVVVGEGDTLAGSADRVVATFADARLVKVPGDHLTAVGAPEFRQAILDFLAAKSPVAAP
ncbi:MAG TPA: alpha/beta hydrolase [Dehalococcoidia bacterium]|nr:alpha/beta hydrolase [Dehalococcoidia bacterium]